MVVDIIVGSHSALGPHPFRSAADQNTNLFLPASDYHPKSFRSRIVPPNLCILSTDLVRTTNPHRVRRLRRLVGGEEVERRSRRCQICVTHPFESAAAALVRLGPKGGWQYRKGFGKIDFGQHNPFCCTPVNHMYARTSIVLTIENLLLFSHIQRNPPAPVQHTGAHAYAATAV